MGRVVSMCFLVTQLVFVCWIENCYAPNFEDYSMSIIINPLYFDGFSHPDKSNKDGIVHYIF